jgi:6-phosphogluconolactonase
MIAPLVTWYSRVGVLELALVFTVAFLQIKYGALQMRLNITGLMRSALPLAALLLLAACPHSTSYTIGGTVTGLNSSVGPQSSMVLQDNGGDNLIISVNGPFTFATAVTSTSTRSATYNVTVLTQPIGQTCTVTGGSGTATNNVSSAAVNCSGTTANYAYVVNAGGTVSQYTIGANGTLTVLASPVAAGTTPYSITVVPSGLYAYVANSGGTVSEYTISSGVLTPNIIAATVTAGSNPVSVTVDSTGQYVYVVNSVSNNVSEYTIGNDGTLAAMTPAKVTAGLSPYSIAVDPLGPYAYVANYGDGTVSEYTIGTGGVLTQLATISAGSNPYSVTVDPLGRYAYVANYGSNNVSQYSIGASGVLTAMTAGPVAAGSNPISVTVDPSGTHVYVANYSSGASAGTVSEYSIGTGGALTAMTPATVAAGPNPESVTVDPSGQFAYVANYGGGTVSQYTISSGVLTPNATVTVTAGTQPIAVITAR